MGLCMGNCWFMMESVQSTVVYTGSCDNDELTSNITNWSPVFSPQSMLLYHLNAQLPEHESVIYPILGNATATFMLCLSTINIYMFIVSCGILYVNY